MAAGPSSDTSMIRTPASGAGTFSIPPSDTSSDFGASARAAGPASVEQAELGQLPAGARGVEGALGHDRALHPPQLGGRIVDDAGPERGTGRGGAAVGGE